MRKIGVSIIAILAALCILTPELYAEDQKVTESVREEQKVADGVREEQKVADGVKEEQKVAGSLTSAFLSQYVFRGYELSSGKSLVIQPSITVSYYGFNLNLWGNVDTNQKQTQSFVPKDPGHTSWNETDLTLSYTYNIAKFSLTGGYIYYGPNFAKDTQEFFLGVGYNVIAKPVLTIYQDIDQYPGTYFQLALSHSLPVYKKITLDLASSFSYMWGQGQFWRTFQESTGGYTGSKYSAFHAGMVSAGFSIPVTKHFVIQPVAQFWFPLSSEARRTVDGNPYNPNGNLDNTFVYGINATLSF
jgi:hypothetical protein